MSHNGDPSVIDIVISLQVIHSSHCAPGTSGQHTPFMSFWKALTLRVEQLVNALQKLHFIVPNQILMVHSTESVAPIEHLAKWPPILQETWSSQRSRR